LKWDCLKKKRVATYQHDVKIRAIDWSQDDTFVIAGDYNGNLVMIDADTFQKLDYYKSPLGKEEKWIEDLKISPDCERVAFGTHRGASKMEIVKIDNKKFARSGRYNIGFTSALTHLDWTADSQFIVANSQAYELYWISASTGRTINASSTKELEFSTWTCALGWPVQGIFPGVDGTDVNTICRTNCKDDEGMYSFIATGDDFQKVNLFKYPSTSPKSGCLTFAAHASHVTKVKFMLADNYLVSTGGNDKTNIIWKTDFGQSCDLVEQVSEEDDEFDDKPQLREVNPETDKYGKKLDLPANPMLASQTSNITNFGGDSLFEVEEDMGGDEFMAVKPWLGAIKAPSDFAKPPRDFDKEPEIELTLDYVHGFRAKDSRQNIYYNANGEVVTHAAAVGFNCKEVDSADAPRYQSHNTAHTDDIMAIGQHPNLNIFATGEIGPKPHIIVWDTANECKTVIDIHNSVKKGVDSIGFSPDGKYIACTGMDDNHTCYVFDWENGGKCVATTKGGTKDIIGLLWDTDSTFITWGVRHYMYWTFKGTSVTGKNCKPSSGFKDIITSGCVYKDKAFHGASNGEFSVWSKGGFQQGLKDKQKPHASCIDDIIVVQDKYILTGGKDHSINVLD